MKALLVLLGSLLLGTLCAQEIPQKISYQGKLLENGSPVTDTKDITFSIGSLWTETHQGVQITNGLYSVTLGTSTPIPINLFNETDSLTLQISVDGTNLSPPTDILSVPYCYKAEKSVDAEKIAGRTVSTTIPTNNQVLKWNSSSSTWTPDTDEAGPTYSPGTGINISGTTINAQTSSNIWNANKLQGRDISTTAPANSQVLKWNGSQWTPQPEDLELPYLKTYSGGSKAFQITNTGTGGVARFVINDPANNHSGSVMQLHKGESAGTDAVLHIYNEGTHDAIDIENMDDASQAININNFSDQESIMIYHNGNDNAVRINQYSDNYDALHVVNYGTGGNAGYFDGDVEVTGTINKGAVGFKIDHPLDPENKYLYHSCIESYDMMNVYNGNIELDKNGEAVVILPDWFEVLNNNYRYQLTCIGGFAPVYISEELYNNTFQISGGTPGLKVSWQVTGIRQDPYANKNRIQVEVEKNEKEKGHYLHYKEYGQPLEKSISIIKNPELIENSQSITK
jgi:hypothetical protein